MSTIQSRVYDDAVAIAPSDTADQAVSSPFAGLFVTATGNLKFTTGRGSTVTLTAVPAFTEIHISCKRVFSTGTTATVLGLIAIPYKGSNS